MKFRDIVEACGDRQDWIRPHFDWRLDGDRVVPVAEVEMTLDTEVEVTYYWNHHMHEGLNKQKVRKDIAAHDWEAYQKWRDVVEEDDPYNPLCYFPDFVYVSTSDAHFGTVYMGSKSIFDLIEHNEGECG